MDCLYLEERLEALSQDDLSQEERSACEEHLDTCQSCQQLAELAMLSSDASQDLTGLVQAVLRATNVDACGRALRLLASAADTPIQATDKKLVDSHLTSCSECRGLATVLSDLKQDLPRLAQLQPGRHFAEDVLRRTLPLHVRLRRWWHAKWPEMVKRPRFASEAAYAGLLVMVMVFATPASPLQAVPGNTLAIIKDHGLTKPELPSIDLSTRLEATTELLRQSDGGRTIARWQAAGVGIVERTTVFIGDVETQFGTLWDRAASLLDRSGERFSTLKKTDPKETS